MNTSPVRKMTGHLKNGQNMRVAVIADQLPLKWKVFVGGLSWDTTKDTLLSYFSQYGEVIDCVVMKNQQTGKSRGFGFVTYRDVSCVEAVLSVPSHIVDGRQVDPKACNPKGLQRQGDQGPGPMQRQPRGPRGGHDAFKDKKIFIGGLPNSVDEEFLKSFFAKYGRVIDVSVMYDQQANRSRGFGFLTLETDEAVDQLCRERYVNINGKKVECKRAQPRSKPEGQDATLQLPGLPMQHLEMAGGPPPQQVPGGAPEGTWPPPDGNWAPGGGQVQASVAAPPTYQNVPIQSGYQEQAAGMQPAGWPPQQQPPQGAGSWPQGGPPPGQQPPPGSAPFVGQPPSTQIYTSPQVQSPSAAPGYQWASPPGQVPPGAGGQPPQPVAVGQTPPGAYGAYVPASAAPQAPSVSAPVRPPYGEFAANGQTPVAPAPGAQLPVSAPQSFQAYASPYGAPVSQAPTTTPADPYAQPAVVPTPGAAIQIPGVPAQAQPQPVPGYGSPVTPTGAVGSIPDPAAGTVKPEYANYYGTYGAASQYTGVESSGYTAGVSTSHIPTGVPPAFPQGGASFTSPVAAQVPSSVTGYTGDATAAAYGATPTAQNPYGSQAEAPQPVAYGGAPGPSPTFQRQGSGQQAYHPYRR